uniref:ER membrane protein complex subunit 8 n=2 Tax=Laurasiatheria TaxID=314145 RepID=A0A5G2R2S6_PIG
MPGVKLTTQAYCKMVLHGAKYPHCAVNGLLVAEKQKPRKEHLPLGGPGAHHTLFVDCIPLFHGTLALAPMLEVALTLIDSWCKDNSYVIAGYYQANERVKDASPNQVAEKVASRIAEGFSDTALIMVDNTKFTMDCVVPTIHVYEHHENKWRCRDPHYDYCEDWPEAQRISASLLDSRSYETLVDFDNHLDEAGRSCPLSASRRASGTGPVGPSARPCGVLPSVRYAHSPNQSHSCLSKIAPIKQF